MPKRKQIPLDNKKRSQTWVAGTLIDDEDLDVLVRMLAKEDEMLQKEYAAGRLLAFHGAIREMVQTCQISFGDRRKVRNEYRVKGYVQREKPVEHRVHRWTLDYKEDKLPPEVGLLSQLERLRIDNKQESAIPPEIGNLRMLKELDLECPYMGSLFEEVGNIINLEILKLTGCDCFTGLPGSIAQLRKLKVLEIPDCVVAGRESGCRNFPFAIGRLPSLKRLTIGCGFEAPWYPPLEAFKEGPTDHPEASPASREGANLVSLEEVSSHLTALLLFPVEFFANSTKLTKMEIICDIKDFSSIDVSYFTIIPSTIEHLTVRARIFKEYDVDIDDDGEEEEEEEINEEDANEYYTWRYIPEIRFPCQALLWQHNLRILRVECTGYTYCSGIDAAWMRLSFSMMSTLVKLEKMHLEVCNIEPSPLHTTAEICLPLLRSLTLTNVKGTVNFEELNLPSLEDFCLSQSSAHVGKITVRVSGLLPALSRFSILSRNYNWPRNYYSCTASGDVKDRFTVDGLKPKLAVFEYDATAQLPELKELVLNRCFFFGNAGSTAPMKALDLPRLQVLTINSCFGVFVSPSNFCLSSWVTPRLHHVTFCHDQEWQPHHASLPLCQQLNMLSTELLARSPQLSTLDISQIPFDLMGEFPKGALSALPQSSIRLLNLNAYQMLRLVADAENSLDLLGRCQQLGSIGNICDGDCHIGEGPWFPSNALCQTFSHLLSLNRARCRLFLGGQAVITALWPLILENPLRVFELYGDRDVLRHVDVDDDRAEVQEVGTKDYGKDDDDSAELQEEGTDDDGNDDDDDDDDDDSAEAVQEEGTENDGKGDDDSAEVQEETIDDGTDDDLEEEEDEMEEERNDIEFQEEDPFGEDTDEEDTDEDSSNYRLARELTNLVRLGAQRNQRPEDAIFLLLRERFLLVELFD